MKNKFTKFGIPIDWKAYIPKGTSSRLKSSMHLQAISVLPVQLEK